MQNKNHSNKRVTIAITVLFILIIILQFLPAYIFNEQYYELSTNYLIIIITIILIILHYIKNRISSVALLIIDILDYVEIVSWVIRLYHIGYTGDYYYKVKLTFVPWLTIIIMSIATILDIISTMQNNKLAGDNSEVHMFNGKK